MEENDKQLATMFNAGYQMEKHDPKLLKSVLNTAAGDSEYLNALTSGRKQRQKESLMQQQKEIKQSQQQKAKPKQ